MYHGAHQTRLASDTSATRTDVTVRQLRVLQVVEAAGAGVGRHVLDLCEGLRDAGHLVHLIYSPARVDRLFASRLAALSGVVVNAVAMRCDPHLSDLRCVRWIRTY